MEKKHLTRFFMLAVAAGTLFGACQKEDLAAVEDDFDMTGRIPLYAEKLSNSSGAKLVATETTAAHEFSWADNDQIRYSGGTITVTHNSIAESDLPTINAENPFIAVYPADACDNNTFATSGQVTITIPDEIEYAGDGVVKMPMMAYTTNIDEGISFKHLAAVLAVKVKNSNTSTINMNKITVSMRTKSTEAGAQELAIAGKWEVPYTVSEEGGITINPNNTAININQDGTNDYKGSITMTFDATPCSIESNGTKYFFFPVRTNPANVGHFTIKVEAIDANENACNFEKTQASKSQAIGRGEIAYAPVALDASTNTHAFKLGNGDDDYYEIATGNLVYNITAGTWDLLPYNVATVEKDNNLPATWFDPDQIDYEESSYSGTDPDGLMSLFFYGTADVEPNATPYYEWDERDITDYNTPLTTNDWGSVVAFREEGWTTPTSAQWKKLFNDSRNYYHYIPSQNGRVTLSDLNIEGYIVVPDISSFVEELRNAGKTTQVITGNQGLETLFIATNGALPNVTFATLQLHGARFIPFTKKIAFDGNSLALQPANGYANIYAAKDAKFFSIDLMDAAELESVNVPVRLIRKVGNN